VWIGDEGRTAVAHADETLTFGNRRVLARLAADAVDLGARAVSVDLAATYVDTAALGMLTTLAHRVRVAGGTFRLGNVRPEVTEVPVHPREPGAQLRGAVAFGEARRLHRGRARARLRGHRAGGEQRGEPGPRARSEWPAGSDHQQHLGCGASGGSRP
jgi:hypothetical protein